MKVSGSGGPSISEGMLTSYPLFQMECLPGYPLFQMEFIPGYPLFQKEFVPATLYFRRNSYQLIVECWEGCDW
jgi:hypothetical protein